MPRRSPSLRLAPRHKVWLLADGLFLGMGFAESTILQYPEKILRYTKISRSELSIGRKFCFTKLLACHAGAALSA